jgi:hypothetical protein
MHPVVAALIELHDVNLQRQLLAKDRTKREAKVTNAEKALAQGESELAAKRYPAALEKLSQAAESEYLDKDKQAAARKA